MKTIPVESYGNNYEIAFYLGRYNNNNTLAVLAYSVENKDKPNQYMEPFTDITVNLPASNYLDPNIQYVDINNFPQALKLIEEYELGELTGGESQSGYVTYPAVKFNLDKLLEYTFRDEFTPYMPHEQTM